MFIDGNLFDYKYDLTLPYQNVSWSNLLIFSVWQYQIFDKQFLLPTYQNYYQDQFHRPELLHRHLSILFLYFI